MEPQQQQKKPLYKRWRVWVVGIVVLFIILGNMGSGGNSTNTTEETVAQGTEWVTVFELTTSANKSSESFRLEGGQQRLSYSVLGGNFAMCSIYVEQEGHDITTQGGFPIVMADGGESDSTIMRKRAGAYYVQVNAVNGNCGIKIEELR